MKKLVLFIAALGLLTACTSSEVKEDPTVTMINSLQSQVDAVETKLADTNAVVEEQNLKNEAMLDELINLKKTDDMIKEDIDGLKSEVEALKQLIMEK
jgi:peptidoglycan hydrolase CwlO-like protein